MKITIFTIFPEIITQFFDVGLLAKARNNEIWELKVVNIRDYSENSYKQVDDIAYGGGQGMVMKPDILSKAIDDNCDVENTTFFYMSPRGEVLNQQVIKEYKQLDNIAIICGRYEGIDQRAIDEYKMIEISIGDYVLMGGELPAMVFVEGLVRCLPGVVGNEQSIVEDSFGGAMGTDYDDLLEYPLYTIPRVWRNRTVPDVLLSGNHGKIASWKLDKAKEITKKRRPDIWRKYLEKKLSAKE